jgi:hypothetical protein
MLLQTAFLILRSNRASSFLHIKENRNGLKAIFKPFFFALSKGLPP